MLQYLPGKEKDLCCGWSGARAPLPGRTAQLPSWLMPDRLGGSWDLAVFSSEGLLFWISSSGLVLQICKTLIISQISRPQPAFEPAGSFNQIYEQGPYGYVCIKLVSLGEQTGKPSNLECSWSYRGLIYLCSFPRLKWNSSVNAFFLLWECSKMIFLSAVWTNWSKHLADQAGNSPVMFLLDFESDYFLHLQIP